MILQACFYNHCVSLSRFFHRFCNCKNASCRAGGAVWTSVGFQLLPLRHESQLHLCAPLIPRIFSRLDTTLDGRRQWGILVRQKYKAVDESPVLIIHWRVFLKGIAKKWFASRNWIISCINMIQIMINTQKWAKRCSRGESDSWFVHSLLLC